VYAERYRYTQGQYTKVTEASLTYVAIDDQGRPRPIPKTNEERYYFDSRPAHISRAPERKTLQACTAEGALQTRGDFLGSTRSVGTLSVIGGHDAITVAALTKETTCSSFNC